jgi:hypothetical protein
MKKIFLFLAILVLALIVPENLHSQTDVTATYLINADFNTPPYCYTKAGGTTLTEGVERLIVTTDPTRSGWIFKIPGWENASIIKNNATQVATGELGMKVTPPGFNGVTPPAATMAGDTTGAALSMSAGWGDRASYYQDVTLPSGRYVMKYDAYNGHNRTLAIANYFGFVPDEGTPIYGSLLSYPQFTWVTDSISFFLINPTTKGRINLGITTASGSSNDGPKLFLDNLKLYYYGIDKSGIKQLVDSAMMMINNPENVGTSVVYADLQDIVDLANLIYTNVNASAAQVVSMEAMLKEAIGNVHGAILLQQRVLTWTNLPYNATEAFVNPGFEQVLEIGWTLNGAFTRQSNASFDPFKEGTFYAQRFVTSGQVISNNSMSQVLKNIPNGIYLLTVSAHAVQQSDLSYPGGAFVVANDNFVEIFERNDYSVAVEVTDNTMTVALEIGETGNWVAFDNFRLTYLSDGVSPYMVTIPPVLNFSPTDTERQFNLTGGNLTEIVTITTSAGFTVSKSTFTAAELMAPGGVEVTVNSIGNKAVTDEKLVVAHGNKTHTLYLNVKESLRVSNGAFMFDQSMVPISNFTLTANVFEPVTFTLPPGVSVSDNTVSASDALAGKEIILMWDHDTLVEDKFMYIVSGSVKDSILIFATPESLVSNWDGDDAEGEGSRLTDFGWSLTQADGITLVAGAFNEYNSPNFGIRYVPFTTQNYSYLGKAFRGHRVAYLRTWGTAPATNVYNLPVQLTEGKTYRFKALAAWHDNGTTPTFSYGINTMKANTGDTLGIVSVRYTTTRRPADYSFIVRPQVTDTYYVTVSSTVGGDALSALMFMSIYETDPSTSTQQHAENNVRVFPTVSRDYVNIDTAGEAGFVRVLDITGKLISSKTLNGNNEIVNLPTEGAYIIQVKAGMTVKNFKVIRVK